jgi:hypothetical protein
MPDPQFVRVKDPQTGHEFDRREDDKAVLSGRFVPVKGDRYPPSPYPRPAKHRPTKLAGRPASRETAPDLAPEANPTEENHDG